MPEPLAPPGGQAGDATGLLTQIAAEEQAAVEAFVSPEVPPKPKESTSATEATDEKKEATEGTTESEEEPASEDATPEEGEEETPPPEGTEEEPPKAGGPVKIGEREFATADDALKEAARIMGHNGNLAGQLTQAQEAYTNLHATASTLKSALDEAVAHNQQWQEWYQGTQEGKKMPAPIKEQDIESLVEKIEAKRRGRQEESDMLAELKKGVEEIEATANYHQVHPIVDRIADKINPLTGKPYTPREAYAFACREVGVQNLLEKKAAPPKSVVNPAARNAAARPAPKKATGAGGKPQEKGFADRMLDEKFPLL
jgi:hypothetical protein